MIKLPHSVNGAWFESTIGPIAFSRSGNGVWQATHGDLFFTVRVPRESRQTPPRLHYFDEIRPELVHEAAEYFGGKIINYGWVRNWIDGKIFFSKIKYIGRGRTAQVIESFSADYISGDNGCQDAADWADDLVHQLNAA